MKNLFNLLVEQLKDYAALPQNTRTTNDTVSLNNSIKELELSLTENNFLVKDSEEERLEMAAKIGSVLLNENEALKEQNLRLAAELASYEGKIEELRNNETKYSERLETLLHQLRETQLQLEQEKQVRLSNQNIFEAHDTELGQVINDYSRKIENQAKTIKDLKTKIDNQSYTANKNQSNNAATQTILDSKNPDSSLLNAHSLLLEVLNVNKKQDHIENMLKTLLSQSQNDSAHLAKTQQPEYRNDEYQKIQGKLIEEKELKEELLRQAKTKKLPKMPNETTNQSCEICVILKEETKNMMQSIRVLESENKRLENEIKTISSNKIFSSPRTDTAYHSNEKKKPQSTKTNRSGKNVFSISLQVAKSTGKFNETQHFPAPRNSIANQQQSRRNHSKGPPLNAKIKNKEENYNDFFNNNINFYKENMTKYYGFTEIGETSTSKLTNIVSAAPASPNQSPVQPGPQLLVQDVTHQPLSEVTGGNNQTFNKKLTQTALTDSINNTTTSQATERTK